MVRLAEQGNVSIKPVGIVACAQLSAPDDVSRDACYDLNYNGLTQLARICRLTGNTPTFQNTTRTYNIALIKFLALCEPSLPNLMVLSSRACH